MPISETLGRQLVAGVEYTYTIRAQTATQIDLDVQPAVAAPETHRREPQRMTFHVSDAFEDVMRGGIETSRICRDIYYRAFPRRTDKINYLSVEAGMLTYLPDGRPHQTLPDRTWSPAGRQSGKPAKVIRQIMSEDTRGQYNDSDFEAFANVVKASDVTNKAEFAVVKGALITTYYNGDRYYSRQGSLTSSCMRYDHCDAFFGIYTDNSDIVKMLVLRSTSGHKKIYGRALVWHIPGFETPIMDRIYGTDATIAAFRAEARRRGWIHRAYNSYERETVFVAPDGEVLHLGISIALPNFKHTYYPYLDTFKHFNYRNGCFANTSRFSYDVSLESTSGGGAPYRSGWPHPHENVGRYSEVWTLTCENGYLKERIAETDLTEPVADDRNIWVADAPTIPDAATYAFGTGPQPETFTGTYARVMEMAGAFTNPDVRYNDDGTWTFTWPQENAITGDPFTFIDEMSEYTEDDWNAVLPYQPAAQPEQDAYIPF